MKSQLSIACFMAMISLATPKPIERGLARTLLNNIIGSIFDGRATFFDPVNEGGAVGACGQSADVDSRIVAMNADQYGDMNRKSSWCGKKLKICSTIRCTVATVTDACPGCDRGCLDVTPAVWTELAYDESAGVGDISWAECHNDCD